MNKLVDLIDAEQLQNKPAYIRADYYLPDHIEIRFVIERKTEVQQSDD